MGYPLPDPRMENPAMFLPGRKPIGPAVINANNEYGKQCVQYIDALSDTVTHQTGRNERNQIYIPSDGNGNFTPPNTVYDALTGAGQLSFVAVIIPEFSFNSDYAYIFQITGAVSRNYVRLVYSFFSGDRHFQLHARGNFGNTALVEFTPQITSNSDLHQRRVIAGRVTLDGVAMVDNFGNSVNQSIALTAFTSEVSIGTNLIGAQNFGGGIEQISFFAAGYNNDRLRELIRDPYQFLIPA